MDNPFAKHDHLNLEHKPEETPLPSAPIEIPPRRSKLPLKPIGVLLLLVVASTAGWRYLRVDYNKSRASGPDAPLLYGQNLAGNLTAAQLKTPSVQQQLLADVRNGYGKTWDLSQLALPTNPPEPFSPERALLLYPQIINGARVEGGGVSMLINAPGANDDTLADNYVTGITPQNPALSATQALQKLILPLDTKASPPQLVYHAKTPLPGTRPTYQLAYRTEISDAIKPFISDSKNASDGGRNRLKGDGTPGGDLGDSHKATPQNKGNGLEGSYYCLSKLSAASYFQFKRIDSKDPVINYDWKKASPVTCKDVPGSVKGDYFSIEWKGKIEPRFSELYTFYLKADNYGTVKVNGTTLIQGDPSKPVAEYSGTIQLEQGKIYDIVVSVTDLTGKASAKLSWSSPSTPKALIPRSQVYTMDALPPFINGPFDTTINETQILKLEATVQGTSPLTYQWQKNGTPIAGATSQTYTVSSAKPSDSGTYRVIVTNLYGAATSRDAVVTVNPLAGGSGTGLKGYYYADTTFTTPKFSRVDSTVDFDWGLTSPIPSVLDKFSVRWWGEVYAGAPGSYQFGISTDNGGRLWIDGVLVIDNWYIPDAGSLWSKPITLTTGKHTIRFDYYEGTGTASAHLWWLPPNSTAQIIRKELLFPAPDIAVTRPNAEVGDVVYISAATGSIVDRASTRRDAMPQVSHTKKDTRSLLALATTPTPTPVPSKNKPATPPKSFAGSQGDGCDSASYFCSIFYDKLDWRDTTSALFKKTLNASWNAAAPASGITADGTWSAWFSSWMANTKNVATTLYPTVQGYLKIVFNGQTILEVTNNDAPKEFNTATFLQAADAVYPIEIWYENNGNALATLSLREVNCNQDGTNCNSKHIFFGDNTDPVLSDQLYYTQKPANQTVSVGGAANFSMNYGFTGATPTVQWQRKPSGSGTFSNVGTGGKQYGFTVASTTDDATQVRAQLSNGVFHLEEDIKSAILTVTSPNQNVSCSPATQNAAVNTPATINAAGGNASYNWTASGGTPSSGTGSSFAPKYATTGTKTITVTSPGAANTATCTIVVSNSTPTPTPGGTLSCSPTDQTVDKNVPATVTADGGVGAYSWYSLGGVPDTCPNKDVITCDNTFTTKYSVTGPRTIKVTRGSESATCNVSVATPTPPPPPPLTCTPSTQNASTNESVTVSASGGTNGSYKWTASGGNPGSGAFSTFTTSYSYAGTKTIKLESGMEVTTCTVTVSSQPPPSTTPKPDQSTEMWVYDQSPIGAGDCAKTSSKYPASPFALQCDPHKISLIHPILNSADGLAWRGPNDQGNNLLTVVAANADLNVEDDLPDDPDKAIFNYPSIFSSSKKRDDNLTFQVGQLNAYNVLMDSLKDFAQTMWPGGADPTNIYRPAGYAFHDLSIDVSINPIIKGNCYAGWNGKTDTIYIEWPCALENTVVAHELFHVIHDQLSNEVLGEHLADATPESLALNEGLADYFALRRADSTNQDAVGKYTFPSLGSLEPARKILALTPSEVAYPFMTYFEVGGNENVQDAHALGAKLANILLQMRNYIKNKGGGSVNQYLRTFDYAVTTGLRDSLFVGSKQDSDQLEDSSIFQQYYIQVYDQLRRTSSFPVTYREFFKGLLYDQARIGTAVGGAEYRDPEYIISRDSKKLCIADKFGKKNPLYYFFVPPINAIGARITGLTVNFSDIYNATPIRTYSYSGTTPEALVQESMHSPIFDFSSSEALDLDPLKTYQVYFTVLTDDGKTSQPISIPGGFKVDRTGCD